MIGVKLKAMLEVEVDCLSW